MSEPDAADISVFRTVWGVSRAPFLLLTPACLLPGIALAYVQGAGIEVDVVLLLILGALAMHVAVNAYNEVHDFDSGLDLQTQRTPFSGGSGTLPRYPRARHIAALTGHVALLTGLGCGALLLRSTDWRVLIPMGGLGVLLVLLYSGPIQRIWWLCLFAPGLGFGGLMTGSAYVVLAGGYNTSIFLVSLAPFFMVNNLLLLNQLPDMKPDKAAGRRHLLARFGHTPLLPVYAAMSLAAGAALVLSAWHARVPAGVIAGLAAWLPLVAVVRVLGAWPASSARLVQALALNVIATLLMPLFMALGMIFL